MVLRAASSSLAHPSPSRFPARCSSRSAVCSLRARSRGVSWAWLRAREQALKEGLEPWCSMACSTCWCSPDEGDMGYQGQCPCFALLVLWTNQPAPGVKAEPTPTSLGFSAVSPCTGGPLSYLQPPINFLATPSLSSGLSAPTCHPHMGARVRLGREHHRTGNGNWKMEPAYPPPLLRPSPKARLLEPSPCPRLWQALR